MRPSLPKNEKGRKKHHELSIKRGASYAGEVLHADVMGPIKPLGVGNVRYVLLIVDEYSRYLQPYPLKKKAEATRHLAEFIAYVNVEIAQGYEMRPDDANIPQRVKRRVRKLVTDRGGEFVAQALQRSCAAFEH